MALVIPEGSNKRMSAQEAELRALEAVEAEVAAGALKLCPCGRMFEPYRPYQKYCSDAHRLKYGQGKIGSRYVKRPLVTRKCKNCGADFETNDAKQRYHSRECYLAFQEKRRVPKEKRTCMKCGKEFESSHWLKRYCDECKRS